MKKRERDYSLDGRFNSGREPMTILSTDITTHENVLLNETCWSAARLVADDLRLE